MVTFAPQVPTGPDPEYLRYSHPITQPGANTGKAIAIRGVSESITQGLENEDTTIKKNAEQKAYEQGNDFINQQIDKLDPIWRKLQGLPEDAAIDRTQARSNLMSFLGDPNEIPQDLRNGIQLAQNQVGMSQNAKGALDKTYFDMQVNSQLKTLYSQYPPAYHNAIRQGMERATGVNGATSTFNSLITSINSFIKDAKTEQEKDINRGWEMLQKGHIDNETFMAFRNGQIDASEMFKRGYKNIKRDADLKLRKEQFEDTKLSDEDRKNAATNGFNSRAHQIVDNGINLAATVSGYGTVDNMISKLSDPNLRDPVEIEKITQGLVQARNQMSKQLQALTNEFSAAVGGKYGEVADPGKLQSSIKENMAFIDTMISQVSNKEYGAAGRTMRTVKAFQDNSDFYVHDNPNVGPYVRLMESLRKIDPKVADQAFSYINNELTPQWRPLIEGLQAKMGLGKKNSDGTPEVTIKSAIDELKRRKASDSKIYDAIINTVNAIPEAEDPKVAQNLIDSAFDSSNQGIIKRMQPEVLEQQTDGSVRQRKGQIDVFRRMLSPDVLKAAQKAGPEYFNKVATFAENTFGNEILPKTLKDFQEVLLERGDRITWNNKSHSFGLDTTEMHQVPLDPDLKGFQGYYRQAGPSAGMTLRAYRAATTDDPRVRAILGNLNRAIGTMVPIAEAKGEDPNDYVFKVMKAYGLDFTDKTPTGLPQAMIQAVGMERAKKAAAEKLQEQRMERAKKLGE